MQPIRNKSGEINSVLILDKDITNKKKTEKYLTESKERYHNLFENTGTVTMVIEENMTISMVNSQTEILCGYSKNEIENKMKWTDFIHPEDLERIKQYYLARRKIGGEASTEYEFRLVDKKGAVKDIFLKIDMIPHTKKSIVSLVNISELKKTQEGLRTSREEYFNLFNHANDLIQVVNPAGKFLAVNKTGYSGEGL